MPSSVWTGFEMNSDSISDTEGKILTYHRIAEAFKYAYAKRTRLGDEDFVDIAEVSPNSPLLKSS